MSIPWNHDAGAFLIYVDECQDGVMSGRFYYPFKGESGSFRDLMQLVLKLEHSLNWEEAPQSFNSLRSFSPLMGLKKDDEQALPLKKGLLGNFSVRVMFRRNASWQGSLTWLDQKQNQSFRSVLELVFLLNSAVQTNRMENDMRPEQELHCAK